MGDWGVGGGGCGMALSCPLTGMGAGLEAPFHIPDHRCNHARMANSYTGLEEDAKLCRLTFRGGLP